MTPTQKEDYAIETMAKLKEIATSRGGRLISRKYQGGRVKLKFQDAGGNYFYTAPAQIKLGTWSPYEGTGVSEDVCRQAMNHLFNTTFQITKNVLTAKVINRQNALELDGYCDTLKIAFEYQGYPSHWRKTHWNYEATHGRDLIKRKYCKKLGIKLIVIGRLKENKDRWEENTVTEHVKKAVISFYKRNKLEIPKLNETKFKVDISKNNHCLIMLNRMKKIALENEGILVSKIWLGMDNSYLFETKEGKRFEIIGGNLLSRGWPKKVDQLIRLKKGANKMYEEFKKEITSSGGLLLDEKWRGYTFGHKVENPEGFGIWLSPQEFLTTGWPVSSLTQNFLNDSTRFKDLEQRALKAGYELLEKKWLGATVFHKFLTPCKKEISLKPCLIVRKGFPKNLKMYMKKDNDFYNEIKAIAEKNGGKLLEKNWLGDDVPHKFQFADGRIFFTLPSRIKTKYKNRGWPQNPNNYFTQIEVAKMSPEERLNQIKDIAIKHSGKVLEKKWLGAQGLYKCQLKDGRNFSIKASQILTTGWPKGETTLFYTHEDYLAEVKKIAIASKGKVLETKWLGNHIPHRCAFEDGREFVMAPASLKIRGWPKNADKYFKQVNSKNSSKNL